MATRVSWLHGPDARRRGQVPTRRPAALPPVPPMRDLMRLTRDELAALAKLHGLSTEGRRQDLMSRLRGA